MKRKILTTILATIIFLTGCWDARELNELGISLVIGFDIEDDKVLITAEIINPVYSSEEAKGDQIQSVEYVQGIGNTILEASRDITLKFDRRLFISHNKVVIFGEEFAKRGLVKNIDQLLREREHRETAKVLIAKGAKAYEVMGISSGVEQIPANYIAEIVNNIKYNPKTGDVNFIQFLKHYYHEGRHPVAGVVEKKSKDEINKVGNDGSDKDYELTTLGMAVFKGDKLVGYLNGNDTKSVNFILNKIRGGIITFPTPSENQEAENLRDFSSTVIIENKTKRDVEIIDNKVILKAKINLKTSMGEIIGDVDVSNTENIKKMEEACSKAIEEGITLAVKRVQEEFKVDIFGFGVEFHKKYPDKWKEIRDDWDQIFSEAEFQINVNTKIIRTGLINTPLFKIKVK
ncbi:MAG: Ger(x)C family spore germination protein [Tissierellia bacterium]|nr:Ger(x)C family spore germination protein [Tissierellia bacterium]